MPQVKPRVIINNDRKPPIIRHEYLKTRRQVILYPIKPLKVDVSHKKDAPLVTRKVSITQNNADNWLKRRDSKKPFRNVRTPKTQRWSIPLWVRTDNGGKKIIAPPILASAFQKIGYELASNDDHQRRLSVTALQKISSRKVSVIILPPVAKQAEAEQVKIVHLEVLKDEDECLENFFLEQQDSKHSNRSSIDSIESYNSTSLHSKIYSGSSINNIKYGSKHSSQNISHSNSLNINLSPSGSQKINPSISQYINQNIAQIDDIWESMKAEALVEMQLIESNRDIESSRIEIKNFGFKNIEIKNFEFVGRIAENTVVKSIFIPQRAIKRRKSILPRPRAPADLMSPAFKIFADREVLYGSFQERLQAAEEKVWQKPTFREDLLLLPQFES